MHGLIFASFLDFTRSELPDVLSAIWEGEPDYAPTDAYPDDDFTRILMRAIEVTPYDSREILLRFGRFAAQTTFLQLHPAFYEQSGSTQQFLLDVEYRIHELVRDTISGAAPPRLHVSPLGSGVSISYTSDRGLCDLLEGLVLGAAHHYGEHYELEQVMCMHRGDTACVFHALPA
ncbi:MAG: hypothetical protein QOF43_733 [Gaiellaceae bacterium]|nr:hypothetical protein [Gaiellaceae bacterium]